MSDVAVENLGSRGNEATSTLGCSIKLLRDIYVSVCMSTLGQNAYAEIRGPNTRMLKVSFGRFKTTSDTHIIHLLEQP